MTLPINDHLDGQDVIELQRFKIYPVASDPGSPVEGIIWYNTTDNRYRYFDGTIVQTISNINDGQILSQDSAPSSTSGVVVWNRTTAGKQGLYRYDTTRSKWIDDRGITLVYGEDNADNNYLGGPGISNAGSVTGYNVPYECTITEISMACRDFLSNTPTKTITLRQRIGNGAASDVQDFTITRSGASTSDPGYFFNGNLNIEFGEEATGERQLAFFASGAGGAALDIVVHMVVHRSVN